MASSASTDGLAQSIIWRIKMSFLKQIEGLLMIGKGVQITHGKQSSCGKLIKFENYAKIHGLSEKVACLKMV